MTHSLTGGRWQGEALILKSWILLFSHLVVSDSLWPPWTAEHQTSLSFTVSQSLLKLMSIESQMPSNRLILSHPLLFLSLIFPSIRIFSSESVLRIRWPKYWNFSFSISPPNEYSGLISFKIDWLDLLAIQGTLKSLLLHHSSKASVLQCSTFLMAQLSHPDMTTGKTRALTRQAFVLDRKGNCRPAVREMSVLRKLTIRQRFMLALGMPVRENRADLGESGRNLLIHVFMACLLWAGFQGA